MFWWIFVCCLYCIVISIAASSHSGKMILDKDEGYLQGFALYMAGLAVFRLVFGSLYLLKWKCHNNLNPKYWNKTINLRKEYDRLRKEA